MATLDISSLGISWDLSLTDLKGKRGLKVRPSWRTLRVLYDNCPRGHYHLHKCVNKAIFFEKTQFHFFSKQKPSYLIEAKV